jgi:hypothetical protein
VRRAGLTGFRFHDLRHTYAALMIAAGAHPKYLQAQARRGPPALGDDATRGRLGYLAGWLDGLAGRLPALHEQPAGRRSLEG